MTNLETRSNPNQLKVGDRLSRISYMEVVEAGSRSLRVRNEEGMTWTIAASILENEAYAANQFTEVQEVSRTDMVHALESAGDSVFTVVFEKKTSQKSIVAALSALDSLPDRKAALNKLAKSMMAGEERTLVGYLTSTEPKMGRSVVVDLEISPDQHRLRLVDHRTIKSLTLRNIKYVLKS